MGYRKMWLQQFRNRRSLSLGLPPAVPPVVYRVSQDWVAEEKRRHVREFPEEGWVSTNDVLTSWYLKISRCTHGWMCNNFRSRVEGLSNVNAGNFTAFVPYWPDEFDTPGKIRHSVETGRSTRSDAPSFLSSLLGRTSGITNWASFY